MESWPFQMRVEGCEHTDQSSDNEGDRDGEIRSAFRWCPHVIHIQTQTHLVQGDCVSETNDDVTGNRTRNDHLLDRSRPAQVAVAFKYWVKGQGGGGRRKEDQDTDTRPSGMENTMTRPQRRHQPFQVFLGGVGGGKSGGPVSSRLLPPRTAAVAFPPPDLRSGSGTFS